MPEIIRTYVVDQDPQNLVEFGSRSESGGESYAAYPKLAKNEIQDVRQFTKRSF